MGIAGGVVGLEGEGLGLEVGVRGGVESGVRGVERGTGSEKVGG